MVDSEKFKEKLKAAGYTVASLSSELGIDDSTFYRKQRGESGGFTLAQAEAIKNALRLTWEEVQSIILG